MNAVAQRADHGAQPGYAVLARDLVDAGLDTLFGLMGEANLDLVACLVEQHAVRYVSARHESAAVAMADGYARASGKVGFATVTCGPGLTNAITAIVGAARNRARILIITGQLPLGQRERSQMIDHAALLAATGAEVVTVGLASELPGAVGRALAEVDRIHGPVVLNVAIPVLDGPAVGGFSKAAMPILEAAADIDPETLERFAAMLNAAKRPILLAGRGAVESGAGKALDRLAEKAGARLATTLLAHGLFADNPRDLGLTGGLSSPENFAALQDADLIAVFGAGLNGWTTRAGSALTGAKILWCDRDPAAFSRGAVKADLEIVGDVGEVATALGVLIQDAGHEPAVGPAVEGQADSLATLLDPRDLCRAIDSLIPRQRTVALDGGHFMEFPCRHLSVPDERGFLFTLGFGAVGMGLATAIGAAVARPDRLSVCVVGDGGLMMSLQEIETAARCRIPLLVLVINDGAYGAEVKHLADHGWSLAHARFDNPDLAEVALSLGARAIVARTLDDLSSLPGELGSLAVPFLVDARVDPEVRAEWMSIMHAARANKSE